MITKEQRDDMRRASDKMRSRGPELRNAGLREEILLLLLGLADNATLALDAIDEMEKAIGETLDEATARMVQSSTARMSEIECYRQQGFISALEHFQRRLGHLRGAK